MTGKPGSWFGAKSGSPGGDLAGDSSPHPIPPADRTRPGSSEEARRVKALILSGEMEKAHEAFADLVAAQQRQASRLALYLLRDAADADEAVQDAFVKVFTHITSYREDLSFEAWFTRILANTCRDRKKARRRRERWELSGIDDRPELGSRVERAVSGAPTPEELVLGMETRRTVMTAIDALPGRQRTVLLLCHVEGQSPREVGTLTGLSESTVRVHLFRALRKLKAALEGSRDRR